MRWFLAIALQYYWASLLVISCFGMVWASSRLSTPVEAAHNASAWRVARWEQAQPLTPPRILGDLLLWRQVNDRGVRFTDLISQETIYHDWLLGTPTRWEIAQHGDNLTLSWQLNNGVLYIAALDAQGQQLLAPIEIADEVAQHNLITVNRSWVALVWRTDSGEVWSTLIDRDGLPRSAVNLLRDVDEYAARDMNGMVWRQQNSLRYDLFDLDLGRSQLLLTGSQTQLADLSPVEGTWLDGLWFREPYVIWGVASQQTPDVRAFFALKIDAPTEIVPLTLPDNIPLRWLSLGPNPAQLYLTAFIDGIWQPIRANISANGIRQFDILPLPAADASPIAANNDYLAWVQLDTVGQPSLIVATPSAVQEDFGEPYITEAPPPIQPTWQAGLRHGLRSSYRALTWLILPFFILLLRPLTPATGLVSLGGYWLAKNLISFGIFDTLSPQLIAVGLASPMLLGLLSFVGIQIIASVLVVWGWRRGTPLKIRVMYWFAIDAWLTWAIFSSSSA